MRMPIVTFMPSQKSVEVPCGTLLFDAALRAGLPVASSCSAQNVCAKCNLQILTGAENLSPQTPWEKKLLSREKQGEADRISCLARIVGDCTVTARYWKGAHLLSS